MLPLLESGEIVNVDAGPACAGDPAPVCDVGDGAFVAGEVGDFLGGQVIV